MAKIKGTNFTIWVNYLNNPKSYFWPKFWVPRGLRRSQGPQYLLGQLYPLPRVKNDTLICNLAAVSSPGLLAPLGTFFWFSPPFPRNQLMTGARAIPDPSGSLWQGRFCKCWNLQVKDIFHGYFAVRLDSPPTGDEPALLLEGFLHVSNIPTNKVCCLTDFATTPSGCRTVHIISVIFTGQNVDTDCASSTRKWQCTNQRLTPQNIRGG